MFSMSLILLAATLLVAAIVRQVHAYNSLKAFGGHWSAGWSRIWQLRTQGSGEMHKRFTEINDKYGSTARISPGTLITCDPDLVRTMNAVRSPYTRGVWYSALKLHPDIDNITSHTNESIHADLRSRMAPGYSGKENTQMEKDVDAQLMSLLALLDEKYLAKPEEGQFRVLDLARVTNFFTLDVISSIAFGQTFGFLAKDEDPFGYIENLSRLLPAIIVFGVYTELTKLLNLSFIKAALPKSSDKQGLGRVMGFAKARVDERFGDKKIERRDMLGSFIRKGLCQQQLESETLTQIIAGSDSTASALRMALHLIATSPPILSRLLQEVEHAIDAGRISRPVIQDSEARRLPYLQACIKEGLRVYPPVTGILAKQVPPEGAWIDVDGVKKFAPAGTQIGWNPWGITRNKVIFGEDSDIFRPERWMPKDISQAEQDRVARMTDTVGLVFGYGRFGCLGRGVATMELNKAVIEILLRYNLQSCNLGKPFDEKAVGFWIHDNMNFILTERKTADIMTVMNGHVNVLPLPGAYDA
ncbi:hypothetical protein AMS68_004969 [Peltaster fructicola]|uniref:P450 monooxygenase n=1 Tax=Peltaster fructicola TaxID=286661 RepID=A0A6H0XXF1_9PEZI|nr:hypothetical protein AMS68_004969 [Peltaster fructicola]